ncbi:cilia- and flagella-associated protein 251-like isoform X2 [Erinaceus europaeus]|uniref:Cilia- and flagella-associated protein 251-like isoform X2 n=1 Tax=Erinaceus europaeus TaxID=9365 RepID=A0ABM3XX37_ERIEU|nr:cilia- and flagella-associated protein 251-like isoform X2 [Erinaceus europaeus]XP_060053386.1 cilia- and flagella-associated protein 251-like isoform X2 [Erinaceus europaeus]
MSIKGNNKLFSSYIKEVEEEDVVVPSSLCVAEGEPRAHMEQLVIQDAPIPQEVEQLELLHSDPEEGKSEQAQKNEEDHMEEEELPKEAKEEEHNNLRMLEAESEKEKSSKEEEVEEVEEVKEEEEEEKKSEEQEVEEENILEEDEIEEEVVMLMNIEDEEEEEEEEGNKKEDKEEEKEDKEEEKEKEEEVKEEEQEEEEPKEGEEGKDGENEVQEQDEEEKQGQEDEELTDTKKVEHPVELKGFGETQEASREVQLCLSEEGEPSRQVDNEDCKSSQTLQNEEPRMRVFHVQVEIDDPLDEIALTVNLNLRSKREAEDQGTSSERQQEAESRQLIFMTVKDKCTGRKVELILKVTIVSDRVESVQHIVMEEARKEEETTWRWDLSVHQPGNQSSPPPDMALNPLMSPRVASLRADVAKAVARMEADAEAGGNSSGHPTRHYFIKGQSAQELMDMQDLPSFPLGRLQFSGQCVAVKTPRRKKNFWTRLRNVFRKVTQIKKENISMMT